MTVPGYLVVDKGDLNLVDQHRAHQRILFEEFLESQPSSPSKSSGQALLIPYTLELGVAEAEILKVHLELLLRFGLGIQEFGSHTFLIDMIPPHLDKVDIKTVVLSLIEDFRGENFKGIEKTEASIAKLASRLALSQKIRLTVEEGQHLIDRLNQCQKSSVCPQGKPIIVTLNPEKISNLFLEMVKR